MALALSVFVTDLLVPLGVATGVLYVAVVWLAYSAGSRRALLHAAIFCSLLTLVGFGISPHGEVWKALANRVLSLTAIWVTTVACQRARQERERLIASQEQLGLTIDSALDAVISIDEEGIITEWNPQAEHTFGWARTEAVGKVLAELIIPHQYRAAHTNGLKRFLATGEGPALNQRLELTALRRNGQEFPVELTILPLRMATGYQFSAFARDITEQKLAAEALQERDERIRGLLNATAEGIYGVDLDGNCTFANAACAKLLGYDSPDEFLGKNMHELMHHTRTDGSHYPITECRIYKAFRDSRGVHVDDEVLWKKDGTAFSAEYWSIPLRQDGELAGSVVTFLDISERKQLEGFQQQLNRDLEQQVAERTVEIGKVNDELKRSNIELEQFAYVASHDLQEPLRKISTFCELLKEELGEDLTDDARQYIEYATGGAMRMKNLIDELLHYSRVGTRNVPLVPTDTNAVCASAIDNLELSLSESEGQVTRDDLPDILADKTQLELLFQNLIGNALKYRSEEPPHIHVGVESRGDGWVFSVTDNGIGMESRYLDRIFVIFQRLHARDEYSGTGIGLAICKKIVEKMGGTIWAESEPGKGSTFYFAVPKNGVTYDEPVTDRDYAQAH